MRDDGESGVRLHRIGDVDARRDVGLECREVSLDDVEVVDVQRRPESGREMAGVEPCQQAFVRDLGPDGPARPWWRSFDRIKAHRRTSSSATRADVPASRSLTSSATATDSPCSWATPPVIRRAPGTTTAPAGTTSGASEVPARTPP